LHRGEIMCVQGNLADAESEIHKARELLAGNARYAEGDACRVLGEIRFLRGDQRGAEEAFRQAHELGWNPLPGWALLYAERGAYAAAIKSLQRGLDSPTWADGQRRGIRLAHLTRIAARAGKLALARRMLGELKKSPELLGASGCEAVFHQARAEVAWAGGEAESALAAFREAIAIWQEVGSRINAAHARLRLAEVLAGSGESDEATLEFSAAEKAFEKMGALPMVERCGVIRKKTLKQSAHETPE
jgi:tetratricopeptide (TPR) repeat protein